MQPPPVPSGTHTRAPVYARTHTHTHRHTAPTRMWRHAHRMRLKCPEVRETVLMDYILVAIQICAILRGQLLIVV